MEAEAEYNGDGYGAFAGIDGIFQRKSGTLIRYGALGGFGRSHIKLSRPEAILKDSAYLTMVCGAVFMAGESFDDRNLKTDFNATVGFSHFNNDTRRNGSAGQEFRAKYASTAIFADCELTKNICRWRNIQMGPWLTASYHLIRNKAHRESGPDANSAISFPRSTSETLKISLGINLEREFFSAYNHKRHTKLFAKAGWMYEPIRSHRPVKAFIGNNEFSPLISSGSRHAFTVFGGFRSRLDDHLEIIGSLLGRLSGDDKFIFVSASVGYSF
jgi:hypothetical protein